MAGILALKQKWQEALSDLITDPKELWAILALDPVLLDSAYAAARLFPLKATRSYVSRIHPGDIHDPLLRQILPIGDELTTTVEYDLDPLSEAAFNPVPGLLHKYKSRVLVTLTSACAVHCRYCFRRHFPYADNNPGRAGWIEMMDYIRNDPNIHEVILSGGDPLSVNDATLLAFSQQLDTISHVKSLRIHTRLPIVLPERVTDELIAWINSLKQRMVFVLHTNHPREINADASAAIARLRATQALLLNQSVLLKGVNDSVDTLRMLSEVLLDNGVLPYYLHLLDKVQGAAHFDISLDSAKALHHALASELPGYLVPKLVREQPGATAKTAI